MAHAKASERRKGSREKYLAGLAAASPDRFHAEWNKRMDSWLLDARRRAKTLDCEEPMEKTPSAFEVVNTAKNALAASGVSEAALEPHNSIDMLVHECCREVSSHTDGRIYRLNLALDKDRILGKKRK